MSDLLKAAQEMLQCVDRMLRDGEWYAAQEKADTLRDALNKQSTHGEGCWSWGPAHYECACRELAKAKGWAK
jgi:hypothetical protein